MANIEGRAMLSTCSLLYILVFCTNGNVQNTAKYSKIYYFIPSNLFLKVKKL